MRGSRTAGRPNFRTTYRIPYAARSATEAVERSRSRPAAGRQGSGLAPPHWFVPGPAARTLQPEAWGVGWRNRRRDPRRHQSCHGHCAFDHGQNVIWRLSGAKSMSSTSRRSDAGRRCVRSSPYHAGGDRRVAIRAGRKTPCIVSRPTQFGDGLLTLPDEAGTSLAPPPTFLATYHVLLAVSARRSAVARTRAGPRRPRHDDS